MLLPFRAKADVENDSQMWSIFRYNHNIGAFELGAQMQLRYTFGDGKLYEEQLNPSVHYKTDYGDFGFIFTLGTNDGFESRREYRYAVEYEFVAAQNSQMTYEVRLRQELRDFTGVEEQAHRFRLLNEVTMKKINFRGFSPSLSSEFNVYINDFDELDETPQGLSSHRTILGFTKSYQGYDLTVSYVHDYGVRFGEDEVRHVLSGTLIF